MKYALLLSLIIMSSSWARTPVNFNHALNEDVRNEIRKDDFKFRKKSHRAPASIESANDVVQPILHEPLKIEKTVRQIGPRSW